MIETLLHCNDFRPRVIELVNIKDHKKIVVLVESIWKFLNANENLEMDAKSPEIVRISEILVVLDKYVPNESTASTYYLVKHDVESYLRGMKDYIDVA